jgi:hypothetical protein
MQSRRSLDLPHRPFSLGAEKVPEFTDEHADEAFMLTANSRAGWHCMRATYLPARRASRVER